MPIMTLVGFLGLIFSLGVLQGDVSVTEEWRGRKARKLSSPVSPRPA
jgi:hypothetical protein